MRHAHMQFLFGAVLWFVLGLVFTAKTPTWGEEVAQSGSAILKSAGVQPSAVTVARQGRLLVLTYNPKSAGSLRSANAGSRGEAPQVAVYKGQRQIASGRFAYG